MAPDKSPKTPKRSGSLLSGASILLVGRYAVAVLGWLGTAIIFRVLGESRFGQYSVIFAVLGIVGFIADLRLSRIVLSEVLAADEEEAARIVGAYAGLRLIIGLVSYVVAMMVVGVGAATGNFTSGEVVGAAIGGLNLIILSVAYGLILLFEARLWLRDIAISNVVGQVGGFALIVTVTVAGVGSLLWYVGASVLNGVIFLLWLVLALRRGVRPRIVFDRHEWWGWIREAAPLALGAALDTIYFRIDLIMLSIIGSSAAAGLYAVGYKFADLLGAVPTAIVTPALTLMVAAWPTDPAKFRRTFRHTTVILTVGAVGACAGFIVFAGPVVTALYGGKASKAADSARLLVVGQSLHFFTILAFTTLVAVKRNRLYPIAMLVGVVVNVTLNLILIPKYSYIGSGWATVITESIVLVAIGTGVARIPGLRPFPWVAVSKTVGAGGVAGLIGWAVLGRIPWPLGLALVGILYLGLVHVLAPNGPGGLRAFGGEPHDDLLAIVEEGYDRPGPAGSPGN